MSRILGIGESRSGKNKESAAASSPVKKKIVSAREGEIGAGSFQINLAVALLLLWSPFRDRSRRKTNLPGPVPRGKISGIWLAE